MPEPMSAPSGGSTIAGIPTKYILIGGGAAALGIFMFMRKSPASASNDSDVTTGGQYGANLGPNASLALGSLETQLLQQSGILQDQAEKRYDSLQSSLDTQATHLSDIGGYQHAQQQSILGLYQGMLFPQGYDSGNPTQVKAWSDWLRDKFPAYGLGELPPGYFGEFDPRQR